MHAQAIGKALLGLAAQFAVLGFLRIGVGADGEARQDGFSRHRPERAALGDLDGGRQRLGNVGEQHRHLGAGLEAVIWRQLVAVGLGDQPAAGDAEQRIMGLVVVIAGEIRLVGRNQRQALCIGEIDQAGLDAALAVHAVALQLDIEAIAEQLCQLLAARRRKLGIAGAERHRDRPIRAAGQRDDVFGFAIEPVELDVRRLMHRRLEEGARIEPHQAAVAALARGEQHDPRRRSRMRVARIGILVAEIDGELAGPRSAGCRSPPSCRRIPAPRTCCRCRSAPAPAGGPPWRARRAWRS